MCTTLAGPHSVEISDPGPGLGLPWGAPLASGGLLRVRAPVREDEASVVRPCILGDYIGAAVTAAREAGAQIVIYIRIGIHHGL